MLGQRDPQATIFDGDQLSLEHVGERTLYGYLARLRHELFQGEDVELYHAKLGRPSVAPSLLCVALLLQIYERCSDAEARDRAAYDQRRKVALGAADREKPFTKSTLQLLRSHLLLHEKARLPFERSRRWRRSPASCARTAGSGSGVRRSTTSPSSVRWSSTASPGWSTGYQPGSLFWTPQYVVPAPPCRRSGRPHPGSRPEFAESSLSQRA